MPRPPARAGLVVVLALVSSVVLTASPAHAADLQPPSVVQPAVPPFVSGTATISTTATDDVGVARVTFYAGSTLVGEDTTAPYLVPFPTTSFPGGPTSITARAVDLAGNATTSTARTTTIDNSGPEVSFAAGPDGATYRQGSQQGWQWEAVDPDSGVASAQCSVVARGLLPTWGRCTSTLGHTVTNLPAGAYDFHVRVLNLAGAATTPPARAFTIDGTPPQTTITAGPARTITTRASSVRVRLWFRSSEAGSTFRCRRDTYAWKACTTGATWWVGRGTHVFRVQARDRVGNPDPTPAVRYVTVRRP